MRDSLDDNKAEDVVVIDLKGKSAFADYMVIASGRSNRQVVAIAEHLADKLKQTGHGYTPVAVCFNCWINRRTRARLHADGSVERLE